MFLQITVLPGIDQYISKGIKQIGETVSLFTETDRKTQRAIRNMLTENPDLIQDFADLEARAPGSLKEMGFGKIADLVMKSPESVEQEISRTTREPTVRAAQAGAGIKATGLESAADLISKNALLNENVAREMVGLGPVAPTGAQLEQMAQFFKTGEGTLSPNAMEMAANHSLLLQERLDQLKEAESAGLPDEVNRIRLQNSILGDALIAGNEIAEKVDFPTGGEILTALQQRYGPAIESGQVALGEIAKAANDAANEIRRSKSASTATQARLRTIYRGQLSPAVKTINELERKGVFWNANMDAAISELRGTTWSGIGGIFGMRGGPTAGGSFTSTDLPTKALSRVMRETMTPDEQAYFNNAMMLVEGTLRPLTGLRIEPREFPNYVSQFLTRGEEFRDNPNMRSMKEERRVGAAESLRLEAQIRPDENITTPEALGRYLPEGAEITPTGTVNFPPQTPEEMLAEAQGVITEAIEEQGGDFRKAYDSLMEGIQKKFVEGGVPNTMFGAVRGLLDRVFNLAGTSEALEGVANSTKSDSLLGEVNRINSEINKLLGKEVYPIVPSTEHKLQTDAQRLNQMKNLLIELQNEYPNASDERKKELDWHLNALQVSIQGIQEGYVRR